MTNVSASLLFLFLLLAVSTSAASAGSSSPGRGLKGLKGVKNQHRNLKGGGDKDGDDKDKDDDKDDGSDIDVDDIVGLGCFSGEATVVLEQHQPPVAMKDLQIGDRVLTDDGTYQPVYAFGHYLPNTKDVFIQLETEERTTLQLTPEHLVFRRGQQDDSTKVVETAPVRADSIQPGDVLVSAAASGATKVIATSIITGEGLYAPFTPKGTIVVNGIVASSYVSLQQEHSSEMIQLNGWTFLSQHKFVHMSLSPLRMACLGISTKFCDGQEHNNSDDNNNSTNGMPSYVYWSIRFQRYMETQNIYLQMLVLGLYMAFISLCMAIESVFGGPTEAPSAVAFLGLMYIIVYRILRLSVRCKIVYPSASTVGHH